MLLKDEILFYEVG